MVGLLPSIRFHRHSARGSRSQAPVTRRCDSGRSMGCRVRGEEEMTNAPSTIARRGLLGAALIPAILPVAALPAIAQIDGSAAAPVQRLNNALLVAMKAGARAPFEQRYQALAPVIEQVFNLDAVLGASIGLSWATMTPEQKTQLAAAFRRYTITSYVSNFDSFDG